MRCQICGKEASGRTEIIDQEFGLMLGIAMVCPDCYECYQRGDREILYHKIWDKLLKKGDE